MLHADALTYKAQSFLKSIVVNNIIRGDPIIPITQAKVLRLGLILVAEMPFAQKPIKTEIARVKIGPMSKFRIDMRIVKADHDVERIWKHAGNE